MNDSRGKDKGNTEGKRSANAFARFSSLALLRCSLLDFCGASIDVDNEFTLLRQRFSDQVCKRDVNLARNFIFHGHVVCLETLPRADAYLSRSIVARDFARYAQVSSLRL